MTSNRKEYEVHMNLNKNVSSSTTSSCSSKVSSLIIAASNKAGMDGIDRSKIDAIIYRESHKSSYYRQQERRDENVNQRIERMEENRLKIQKSNKYWKEEMEEELEDVIRELLESRRRMSTHVVFDMDSFYISCEYLTKPHLRDVPACVGHSMISTSNYCARRYGVRSAMPGFIADTLVQEISQGKEKLIHVDSDFDLYKKKSEEVKEVLLEYDPNLKMYSLDEAYVQLETYLKLRFGKKMEHDQIVVYQNSQENCTDDTSSSHMDKETTVDAASVILQEIRGKVHSKTGLTCSAGLAPNFMLAKIASDINKPDGQLTIGPTHDEILKFLSDLNIRKVPGIGRVMEKILNHFQIHTVPHIFDQRALLSHLFSKSTSKFLLCASLGWDDNNEPPPSDTPSPERKGISRERTFSSQKTFPQLIETLHSITKSLSKDMEEKSITARTLTLKVKFSTFDMLTRSYTVPPNGTYLESHVEMIPIATDLFQKLKKEKKVFLVRLIGVRCSNFMEEHGNTGKNHQLNMLQFVQKKEVEVETIISIPDDSDDFLEEGGSSSSQSCPICHKAFQSISNEELNQHLDICLNSSKVVELAKEDEPPSPSWKKPRTLTDFFHSSKTVN